VNKEKKTMFILATTCAYLVKGNTEETEKASKYILWQTKELMKTLENRGTIDLQQKLAKIEIALAKFVSKEIREGREDDEDANHAWANSLGIGFALSLLWEEEIRGEGHRYNQLIGLKARFPRLCKELMEIVDRE
jgi:hypothetical protein